VTEVATQKEKAALQGQKTAQTESARAKLIRANRLDERP
jgi:hypothetical protein